MASRDCLVLQCQCISSSISLAVHCPLGMIAGGGYSCFKYLSLPVRRKLPGILEKVKYMRVIAQKIETKRDLVIVLL